MDRITCTPTVANVRPVRSDLNRGRKHKIKCRCPRCGEAERLRWVGRKVKILVSNLCHLLGGICGKCMSKEVKQ